MVLNDPPVSFLISGTDVKLIVNARAMATIGKGTSDIFLLIFSQVLGFSSLASLPAVLNSGMTLRDHAQGCWRMRGLGQVFSCALLHCVSLTCSLIVRD